ncbi:hypothetical protein [Labedaea rhizosphaerae]|uniref:Uncharacterized protein n=1 Tax=Labedaea rhizosphaerae TaxID=598644 RepID=A0A4R6SN98_LABRH|nr:hypothetical protein [Labedaea rhizosphaerae]TDQ04673.1 hypothetical protein EV186_101628 [Labedaea rhizosphaerae]
MSTHANHLAVLATLTEHLITFDLPCPIASTAVHHELTGQSVTIQLSCRALPGLATALLEWADTLTNVAAEAWRTPSGDSVHLTVAGHLANGTPVQVYGGLSHKVQVFGPYLEPGEHHSIPLGLLRQWADLDSFRESA